MWVGGLTLPPRGGVSARLKPQNTLPQLVLIGNFAGNFSADPCVGTSTEQAAVKAGLRCSNFLARFWSPGFLRKGDFPSFVLILPWGPALGLDPSSSPCPVPPKGDTGVLPNSLSPHKGHDQTIQCGSHWTFGVWTFWTFWCNWGLPSLI